MYIMNVCLVILVILLFFIYVYVDEHKEMLFEGLQNEEDGSDISGIAWSTMYTDLTTTDSGTEYADLVREENNPFSSGDFKANLIQSEVENDFKYFNNATAIYAGYSYKEKS